jgi:hypothetical protein
MAVPKELREHPAPTTVVVVILPMIMGVLPVIVGMIVRVIMVVMRLLCCHRKILAQIMLSSAIAP